jgi:hypothetical protein
VSCQEQPNPRFFQATQNFPCCSPHLVICDTEEALLSLIKW